MRRSRWRLYPALAVLPGCEGRQSVLAPMGPEADILAGLTWLLFIGGGAVLLLTMLVLALALRGGDAVRRAVGSRRMVLLGGLALPAVVLTALLLHTLGLARALGGPVGPEALRIEVTGRQFWWEVRYPREGFTTANEIRVPVGRKIDLHVDSGDVIHSFWIPGLHGKIDMIPGRVNRLRLRVGTPGVLRGQCAEFCGSQHAFMAFEVVGEDEAAFARWTERLREPVAAPDEADAAAGWAAFGQAGCGGCHTIRGTPWQGRAGPDLTAIGLRSSIAAGTLANHREALTGWIAAPQSVKPGNRMPGFAGVLDEPGLRAIALWLGTLR